MTLYLDPSKYYTGGDKQVYLSKEYIREYVAELLKIVHTKEYYNWFFTRIGLIIEDLKPLIDSFYDEYNRTIKDNPSVDQYGLDKSFSDIYNITLYMFSKYYHIAAIYSSCEACLQQGNISPNCISPYFVQHRQLNMSYKFFEFVNTDQSIYLMQPLYQFLITQTSRGRYQENPQQSEFIFQEIQRIVNLRRYRSILLFVTLYLKNGSAHQNILVFKENREIFLIEPNFINEGSDDDQAVLDDIQNFVEFIKGYVHRRFPLYTFNTNLNYECSLPRHGNFCSPLSIIMYIKPEIVTYRMLASKLVEFITAQTLIVKQAYESINQHMALAPGSLQPESSISLNLFSVYDNIPGASSGYSDGSVSYNGESDEGDSYGSYSFGKKSASVKQLKKDIKYLLK
jgi:hypothetical protein